MANCNSAASNSNAANTGCTRRSNGISDNNMFSNNICILADRVFDGVRADLDNSEELLLVDLPEGDAEDITVLSAQSSQSLCSICNLEIQPFDATYSVVSCDILAPGTCTYVTPTGSGTTSCRLVIPYSALMQLPEDSILPYELTARCTFVSEDITQTNGEEFSAVTDGMVLTMATGLLPVYIPIISQFGPASITQRQFEEPNCLFSNPVFPARRANAANTSPVSEGTECDISTL